MSSSPETLLLLLLLPGLARPEWVDIPQFSDQRKVYRAPISFDRRLHDGGEPSAPTLTHAPFTRRISFDRETNLRNVSGFSKGRRPSLTDESYFGTIATFTTERIITSIIEHDMEGTETSTDEDVKVESSEDDKEQQMSQFGQPSSFDFSNEQVATAPVSEEINTTPVSTSTVKPTQCTNGTKDDKGFLDYLPIELLKKVHKTLKSQPPSLRGKIRFLKVFESTLLDEIESRLSAALAPVRAPRGARGHYDDHDEGIGFPSLEGTLMAISFLTFAVYLVRLVMMLFRSSNNNGSAPIFIGRKKRSVEDLQEEAARILSYLDPPWSHRN